MTSTLFSAQNAGLPSLRENAIGRPGASRVVVTAVLVVHDGAAWLRECLDALALQTRPPDRLFIVDTGSNDDSLRIATGHARIRQVVGVLEVLSAPDESTFGQAVGHAVRQPVEQSSSSPADPGEHWLWLLHDDSAAAPDALSQLLDAARRSPSVGIAGPKLVSWDDPSRLLEVGWLITRSGRRVEGAVSGKPDQGQHDHRSDVMAVSTSGMLIRRDVFDLLGGFEPTFGRFCDDLDLCWRAQLAGHRVVVAPRARMREAAASANGRRSPGRSGEVARRRERRHGRQVALARCSLLIAPLMAIWIAAASVGSAAVLLLAKRPRAAWAELGDLGSVMNPWRPVAARWRSRGIRRVRRRDLRGLFDSPRAGFGRTLDAIHEGVARAPARAVDDGAGGVPPAGAGWQIVGHPGLTAVTVAVLLAVVAWRSLYGALNPSGLGVAGGEVLSASGDASALWHGWLDGWHGAGLGNGIESAPYLPVLAAGTWVLEHLPLVDASESSVGVAIAWLLAAAVPLSAWSAYLGAAAVTRARWPRAWAALAWASLATLTTAVGSGRLGAVVAHILLPLVAAGFICATRRSAGSPAIFGTALALGVAGAFNPALAVLGAVAALVLLVVGRGRTRLRAIVLLLVPVGLWGPWILTLADHPLLLLAGPGLTVWHGGAAAPWQLELLHPGGAGSYPALLSAPILLAGVVAISARSPRETGSRTMTVLAVIAAIGLVLGVLSPHVVIGHVPPEAAGAGSAVTGWPGTGLDLAALALIAASLRGYDGSSWRPGLPGGRRRILVPSLVTVAVLGVVGSVLTAGWLGIGGALTGQEPNLPAVAADQAHGPLGSRLLALSGHGDTIGYRLSGAEPGPVVRDLPPAVVTGDPLLTSAVRTTVADTEVVAGRGVVPDTEVTSAGATRDALAALGIGFVAFHGASTEPLVSRLDATAGLTRLSNNRGLVLWRVQPRGNAQPSRLRLVGADGAPVASMAVTGDHGRTEVGVGPAVAGMPSGGRRLVVAEPARWADRARVTLGGRQLSEVAGTPQPTYLVPPEAGPLKITLAPTHQSWRWGQLGLLLVVLFLAVPVGSSRSRGAP